LACSKELIAVLICISPILLVLFSEMFLHVFCPFLSWIVWIFDGEFGGILYLVKIQALC
jgi:hypothetical protein